MKLATGLRPSAERWTLPEEYTRLTLGGVPLVLPTPDGQPVAGGGRVAWVLQLKTDVDSATHPRGRIMSVMLLAAEPTIRERNVQVNLLPGLADMAADYEAHARRTHGIPDDAIVTDYRDGGFEAARRVIRWWEVVA